MELIKLDTRKAGIEISDEIKREAIAANELLHAGNGKGSDFLGWITLPSEIDEAHLAAINAQAAKLREVADVVICIGIGGCYRRDDQLFRALPQEPQEPYRPLRRSEHL